MEIDNRHPKQSLDCPLIGIRAERPLKRLLDGYSREAQIGHLLAWLRDQQNETKIFYCSWGSTFLEVAMVFL